jgi:hypothetical protein
MNETRKKAPRGKYRVIGVDMFSNEDYLVGDYKNIIEAMGVLVQKNQDAQKQGTLPDRYYAYDDKGRYIG